MGQQGPASRHQGQHRRHGKYDTARSRRIRENHGIGSRAVAREVGHSAMTLSSLPCQPVQCPPRNMRTPSRRRGTGAPLPLRQARDVDAFDAPLLTQLVASAGRRAPEADWLPPAPRYQPHRAQAHSVPRHAMHRGTVAPLANQPRPHPPVGTGSRPRSCNHRSASRSRCSASPFRNYRDSLSSWGGGGKTRPAGRLAQA